MGIEAAIGGSILNAGASAYGTYATNKTNLKIAREQMKFQERMSSTAHQREVADLRKAGLNPILSATGGSGASAPGGATATMENMGDDIGEGIESTAKQIAYEYEQKKADLDAKKETVTGIQKDNENKDAQNAVLRKQVDVMEAQIKQMGATTGKTVEDTKKKGVVGKISKMVDENVVTPVDTMIRNVKKLYNRHINSAVKKFEYERKINDRRNSALSM